MGATAGLTAAAAPCTSRLPDGLALEERRVGAEAGAGRQAGHLPHQRLRYGNAQAFLDLRNAVAAEAAAAGLTDDKLDEILRAGRA